MPKTTRTAPEEKELAATIRNDFNGAYCLTLEQVMRVIGAKSPHTARKWVSTLRPRWLNGRKTYLVLDVAHKILSSIEKEDAS